MTTSIGIKLRPSLAFGIMKIGEDLVVSHPHRRVCVLTGSMTGLGPNCGHLRWPFIMTQCNRICGR